MPTVFNRLQHYCNTNTLVLPERNIRAEIGKQIAHIYIQVKKKEAAISRIESVEPEGTFFVITYPKTFLKDIDNFIAEYMTQLADKQIIEKPKKGTETTKRKRIPIPAYPARKK